MATTLVVKKRDDKKLLKEALKQHVIQKALADNTLTLERLDAIEVDVDTEVIDRALQGLSEKKPIKEIAQARDFERLELIKGGCIS